MKKKRIPPVRAGLLCIWKGLCNQCSFETYGFLLKDFYNTILITDSFDTRLVECLKCGYTLIDEHGNCLLAHDHEEYMKQGHSEYVPQSDQIIARFFGPQGVTPMSTVPMSDEQDVQDEPSYEIEQTSSSEGSSDDYEA